MGLRKIAEKLTLGANVFHKYLTVKQFNAAVDQILNDANTLTGDQTFSGDVDVAGTFTATGTSVLAGVTVDSLESTAALYNADNVGTAEAGVTCSEYGDGFNHVTVLSFSALAIGSAGGAADLAFGKKLYTFPSGSIVIDAVAMGVALNGAVAIQADTPDVGVGDTVASGAVALLDGTAAFETYVTGQTAADVNGSVSIKAQVGPILNESAGTKTVYLNVADGWAAAGAVTATGYVTIAWKTLV